MADSPESSHEYGPHSSGSFAVCADCGDSYCPERGHECEPRIMMCLRVVRDEPDDGPTVLFQVHTRDLERPDTFSLRYVAPALRAIRNRLAEQRHEAGK